MHLPDHAVTELLTRVRQAYPDWSGFDDPRFEKDEIAYKQTAVRKAQELLGAGPMEALVQSGDVDEIIRRLEVVARSTNLLYQSTPSSGDLSVLYDPALDKPPFCARLFDLLHGAGTSPERLVRYVAYLESHGLPNKWPFPTYFLFLLHPETDFFVKPRITKHFLTMTQAAVDLDAPSGDTYAALLDLMGQLRHQLANQGARDMIDVQSFFFVAMKSDPSSRDTEEIAPATAYWKIAPGREGVEWDDWREQGYIAIGWDAMGDLGGLSREAFDKRYSEMASQIDDYGTGGQEQIWKFAHVLKEGDRVVANRGTTRILGIGTVTGPYSFVPGVHHGHRRSVVWDDVTERTVVENGWRSTLIALDADKFHQLEQAPATVNLSANFDPDCPFSPETFRLLAGLRESPTKAYYDAHKEAIKTHIEEPFQQLLRDVAATMPTAIVEAMEMERNVFARITKNDYGRGGAWDFYWGAFYTKGGKRITDAQLFGAIRPDRFEAGFYVGEYGSEQRTRFIERVNANRGVLPAILGSSLAEGALLFGARGNPTAPDFASWLDGLDGKGEIRVSRLFEPAAVLALSRTALVEAIRDTFLRLFPLVLLATADDPLPAIGAFLERDAEDEPDLQPRFTLDDLSHETGYAASQLAPWRRALDRKKQIVFYGPPGTGKTYLAQRMARAVVSEQDGFIDTVQFHPAYSYEDFIQGIRPRATPAGGIDYPLEAGRFVRFCQEAAGRSGPCVLIIDEINRANLSRVFGELMYLLEYRDQTIPLAAGTRFRIPPNVYLIGTMNTADRSIALVDHALRRRFSFIPLAPDFEILRRRQSAAGCSIDGLIGALKEINTAIANPHYEIGISFFLVDDLAKHLEDIWTLEILPYLEEYFFDQPEKVRAYAWQALRPRFFPA